MIPPTNNEQFIRINSLLLKAGRCVSVPVPLVGREDEDISAEGCISLWNTVLLFSPQSVHFLTVKESWRNICFNQTYQELSWQVSILPKWILNPITYSVPSYSTFYALTKSILRLMTCRPSCYIANTVFPPHRSTMSHFYL